MGDKLTKFLEKTFPFIVALRKKREAAIIEANKWFDKLTYDIKLNSNGMNPQVSNDGDVNNEFIIANEPIKYFDNIFMSANYKTFVKYAFVAKKYQKKIDNFSKIAFGIILFITALLYLLVKSIPVAVIVFIILMVLMLVVSKILMKGQTYGEFYKEKVYDLIFSILPGYTVTYNGASIDLTKEIVQNLVKFRFDRYKTSNHLAFQNDKMSGNVYNMEMEKDIESRDKNGNVTTTTKKVFDGFSITLNYGQSFDFLKGAIIKIRDDESAFSAFTEDTLQSIHQSDKEFMFNSEELNKAFDCFIEGTNSFGDIDDLMQRIQMIITPMFEEQLLFLRKRYNTFNMTITDTMLNFNVNMSKSSYQKMKSGDKFSWKTKYRDYIKLFKLPLPGSAKANDFMLYKMFPPAEKLFFILYFDNLMREYLHRESMKVENFELMKSFQTTDLEISVSFYDEFKKKYKEEIEAIFEESKSFEINLGREEYYGKNI